MQEGDIVKIDLLVATSGNRKSKDAWVRIKKDFEELAQQTDNRSSVPCGDCGKLLLSNMECDNTECVRVMMRHSTR